MARYLDFSLDQGATLSQKVNYQNSNKSNLSLSGFDVRAQMRRSQYSANAVSITATVSDANSGEVTLSLAANVTAALRPGRWFYDVEANTTNDATVIRIVEGIISVMPGVTGTVATVVPTGTTTSAIPEGTNLYFTNARVWANISPRIAELTTSNIAEGANLYFSNDRVYANVIGLGYATNSYVDNAILNPTINVLKIDKGIREKFESKSGASGEVTHDCSNGQIFYHTSASANWTANLINLSLTANYATAVSLVIVQGATGYYANALLIDGTSQTIRWLANGLPTANTNSVDVQTFSILSNGASYTVLGQLTSFG